MDFRNASLEELRKFVKENKIKGVSALRKPALIEFLEENYGDEMKQKPDDNKTEEKKETETETQSVDKPAVQRESEKTSIKTGKRQTENNQEENRDAKHYGTRERGRRPQGNNRKVNGNVRNAERPVRPYYDRNQNANRQSYDRFQDQDNRQGQDNRQNQDNRQSQEYEKTQLQDAESRVKPENAAEATAMPEGKTETQGQRTEVQGQQEGNPTELDSGKTAHGILEVMADGYGFIRSANYLPGDQDIYVSPAQIRRFGLKTGDIITGNIRIKTQGEKFSALLYVGSVNGESPAAIAGRKAFEDLTPIFPNERIGMDGDDSPIPIRMIDLLSPIGKGQRGMIVSPPKAGKTTLLKQIAKCISTRYSDIHLLVLLIDERPEEVTDIRESIEGPNVEVIYSTFDELPEHHKRVSEMVIERAKRLVEQKKDVVILLDSITRLARAYNLTVPPSGRTLSGGLDPAALHMPKKFFGAARNMREGGSLTILATALVDTGSKMDDVVFEEFKGTGNMELVLDRKLAEKRIFPAIDIAKSSTRRDDLLLNPEEQEVVYALHKVLSGNKAEDMLEDVLKLFVRTKNNKEFIYYVKKSLLRK